MASLVESQGRYRGTLGTSSFDVDYEEGEMLDDFLKLLSFSVFQSWQDFPERPDLAFLSPHEPHADHQGPNGTTPGAPRTTTLSRACSSSTSARSTSSSLRVRDACSARLGGHSPTTVQTDGEAANPGPRLRRRGPRSIEAKQRRYGQKLQRIADRLSQEPTTPTAVDDTNVFQEETVEVLHCNIRGWISHSAELAATIRLAATRPLMVCVNETFLDKTVEDVALEGYCLIGRRDRGEQQGGGVLAFALKGNAGRITLVKNSDEAERMWFVIHSDQGPYAVCTWYRPPAPGEVESISSFQKEWEEIASTCAGTIAIGDFNVHAKQWLKWSSGESPEGLALESVCHEVGARQMVRNPTRNEYLLDLVLTDLDDVKAKVTPGVSDHEIVTASLKLSVPDSEIVERQVWQFRDADWEKMGDILDSTDWTFIESLDANAATEQMSTIILAAMDDCIPQRILKERKSSHPWLTDRAVHAVKAKHAARRTDQEQQAATECSRILLQERESFRMRACNKLSKLPAGSKQWWSKSRQLMDRKSGSSSIPALKAPDGHWILDAEGKAEHLATTFAAKCTLPDAETGAYTDIMEVEYKQLEVPEPDEQIAFAKLNSLNEASATGPDAIPARVLKIMAAKLARPVTALVRRIVQTGVWPSPWLRHWITPLYKKKAVYDARNYRGVHLTAQLSKVCERMVQVTYVPFLIATVAFGPNQFAYSPGRGSCDAVAILVLT